MKLINGILLALVLVATPILYVEYRTVADYDVILTKYSEVLSHISDDQLINIREYDSSHPQISLLTNSVTEFDLMLDDYLSRNYIHEEKRETCMRLKKSVFMLWWACADKVVGDYRKIGNKY